MEAFRINQKMILDHLEKMPKESEHCAQLAADTLKEALRNYLMHKRELWKRNYRSS
jgi:NifU-like protein involved in Fe-S cluster formation